jgi:exodeoxyribonuclease VII large subunit
MRRENLLQLFAEKHILTVTRLTALIRGVLEENFEHVWVEGEVSNLATPSSGHCYFTLKDSGAQVRCVMFRASARALKFRLQNGMGLILRGRISVYDQRGEYQLIVEYMEPKGIGALQLAFIQLKERLAKEGLFDESSKKQLPVLPNRIGIVTSATGAAIHDIMKILRWRYVNVELLICPVKVQGEGAAEEIAAALRNLNRYGKVDVIIVGRGGGSLEDLWAFNEEIVARAIYDSRIPVVSAVGHEIDFTIADFVADLRAPTPSAAAELVVKNKTELAAGVDSFTRRLEFAMTQTLRQLRSRIDGLARAVKDPAMLLGYLVQRVDDLSERLERAYATGTALRRDRLESLTNHLRLTSPQMDMERCRERLITLAVGMETAMRGFLVENHEKTAVSAARLQALSPLATLARGYSVACRLPEGKVIRDSRQIEEGDRLKLTFHRGVAVCSVESVGG